MLHCLRRTLPLLSSARTTIRTMSSTAPSSPINLVSVNTHPDRAQRVIGSVIQSVKDKYTIVHAGNSTTIEGVKPLLESTECHVAVATRPRNISKRLESSLPLCWPL
ncbi:hypothetical protein L198_08114 [Cryptococcus wingfieldii CBS 7118]|uniref:Uncharacterized protein n=1 Tax=Cryptococcus wingfieldii CBS 7118 TaxID=1295528 RepID=A0A1E3HJ23_9TREE|nr:hypothetical protein L198_08114 [Cryptococcus wingfieldii CBS 7118]ODN76338.1 hypothetical protein L198_08114 [Cryptococcus wingfieldii CBS 7118]